MSNIEELLAQQRKLDRQGRFEEADRLFKTCGAFDSFSNAGLGAIEGHGKEGDGKSEIRLELGESKLRPSSWFRQLKSVVVPMPVQYVQRYHAMPNLIVPMKVAVQMPFLKAMLGQPSYSATGNDDADQHRLHMVRHREEIAAYIASVVPENLRKVTEKNFMGGGLTEAETALAQQVDAQAWAKVGRFSESLRSNYTPMRNGDSITGEGIVIRRNRIGGLAKEISIPYELCASHSNKRQGNLSAIYDKAAGGGQVVELMQHTLHSATGATPEHETDSNVIGDTSFEEKQAEPEVTEPEVATPKQSWIERMTQRLNNATRESILSDLPNLSPEQQARIQELSRALNNAQRNLTDKENKLATGRANGTITTEREANLLEQVGYYQNLITQITHDIRMVQYS